MYSIPLPNGSIGGQPLDVDAMLFDVSNRMARAQLARQISNSSSISRKSAARVSKPRSSGNSPQIIQRRKTITSYNTGRNRPELCSHDVPTTQKQASSISSNTRAISAARPLSWHPSSISYNRPAAPSSVYYASSKHPTADYPSNIVNKSCIPEYQPTVNLDTVNPYLGHSASSASYQPSTTGFCENNQQIFDPDLSSHTYASYYPVNYDLYQNISFSESFSTFQQSDYSAQTWNHPFSSCPTYTNPPTPNFLPIQHPSDMWAGCVNDPNPSIPKRPSKELVGMGLYDSPNRDSFVLETAMDQHFGDLVAHPQNESTGKGLKLEETWQPPDDDNLSETDSQDGEETDSVPEVCQEASTRSYDHNVVQATLFAPYDDLSNQSFYFENDENCFDGISLGQSITTIPADTIRGYPQ